MAARNHRHINVGTSAKPAKKTKGEVLLAKTSLPPKPDELSWRDYLIMLLHIASELEHALMVEYLFAAYSLGGEGAAKAPREVREWRDTILTVAREEMGHLITVQNTLLLIGGPVSFERDDYPWSSPFYPFEFKLEPLSLDSLACYVYAEMPGELEHKADLAVRASVEKRLKLKNAPRVGEVYDAIIELIGDTEKIPEETFNADSYKYQATWDEWGRGYRPGASKPYTKNPDVPPPYERKTRVIVDQMATRTEAVAALRDVAGQGEAEHQRGGAKMEPSHFDRFAEIYRAFEKRLAKDKHWSPSRKIAVNPFAGAAKFAPKGATPIVNPASSLWASLFNIRYRMLLTLLTYTYRVPSDSPEEAHLRRAPMMARIFGEMYNLKAIAGVLVRLPLGDPKKPERAGPPFQSPYTLTPPVPEANFWRTQRDLLHAAEGLVEQLLHPKAHGLAPSPTDGVRYLKALRATDANARVWIEQLLDGINPSRRTRA